VLSLARVDPHGAVRHHTGVIQNFGLASYPRFDEKSNLAVWLHQAGYDTALPCFNDFRNLLSTNPCPS
jgi:hypothetical protein